MSVPSERDHDSRPDRPWAVDPDWGDARTIRQVFGVPAFEKLEEQFAHYEDPYPNCLYHEADAERYDHEGGTNFLAVGGKGSGKSTLGLEWATRLMETNDEAVIWRGARSRSEWLPLKPWTKLLLPANADITATWRPRDIRERTTGEPADLEDHVAEVAYYDGLRDLLDRLEPHQFHVVYPDPTFAGCTDMMSHSDYSPYPVEYVPLAAAEEPDDATPLVHWWVAFCVARLEYGPYDWTSLIFDEAADLLPDGARADKSQTYEKVKAMRRVMADSRKYFLSLFMFAHDEVNVHSTIRRTFQWRVNMPDGTANPCQTNNDQPPVGFNQIPMRHDMLSQQPVGRGLFWNETNFTRFPWNDFKPASEDSGRWLKIDVRPDPNSPARVTDSAGAGKGVGDD